MSGFRYNRGFNDGYAAAQGRFDDMYDGYEDEYEGNLPMPGFMSGGPPMFNRQRRARYGNAYGDYQGGYGPGGGYGPRPLLPPPMPPGPPMRGAMWGRGFGPGGPPRRNHNDDRAIKYLMRCGVTKDNLKNLPHDLLTLIQPEHCGLCDTDFDSFTISRMHYISKNHLKAQKKFLAKSSEAYLSEAPLKSRSLYCELCDIQITSKAHGEAHYIGKQHRGIVDGRKKPKNPLLLQPRMQHRYEQLIRREKRSLKALDDKAKPEEEVRESKATPDLYCDICKTTMTCSEQMTMHMNGKRHLSKEKQHILNMMKGKTNKANEAEQYEEGDVEDEDVDMEKGAEGGDAAGNGGQAQAEDAEWGDEAWENNETATA